MKAFKPRTKKCRNTDCAKQFLTARPMQSTCGIPCALADARRRREAKQAKVEREETRAAKVRIKGRSDHMRDAQVAFNACIREIDHAAPCVSCGRHHDGQYHAGHYLSVGARPELRFEPMNCWKQCAPCNTHLSGNPVLYRKALTLLVGSAVVDWLEGPHEPRKYTVEELQELTRYYRAARRALVKLREQGSPSWDRSQLNPRR